MGHVDLARRFYDLPKEELESPEALAYWSEHASVSMGWDELLKHPRVVLLAEAGSGKTEEMRTQAARLTAEGKPAFFVPLESLAREPLRELLYPVEQQALAFWRDDDQATAFFFLDAVDELKLTQGKLERALSRLAREIEGLLHRVHVIISCRPFDWRPTTDMTTVQTKLPFIAPQIVSSPANVATKLREDPERPGAGRLPEERARSGAERLALRRIPTSF